LHSESYNVEYFINVSLFDFIFRLINNIADLFYHCVSGCMTAQTAHEVNYQNTHSGGLNAHVVVGTPAGDNYAKY
jgi:hypothetical protein